jgi:hypothetical protein
MKWPLPMKPAMSLAGTVRLRSSLASSKASWTSSGEQARGAITSTSFCTAGGL